MNTHDRVQGYVRRYFKRHAQWPTVRHISKALCMRQGEVEQEAQEGPLMLTSYFVRPPDPLGEHFVEICE